MKERNVNVLIIGAGPAGLAAALQLDKLGVKDVLVVDRDKLAGGAPRLINHTGFGLRDIKRLYTGPQYARQYVTRAEKAGITILSESTVTGWENDNSVHITSPKGLQTIHANAILLATGCRERPRAARMVPGSRPQGIYTTGSLQDFVHGYHKPVGKNAVIVGAELVSYSAIHTLAKVKCNTVMMVTEHPRHQVYMPYLPYKWFSSNAIKNVPLETDTTVCKILGKDCVTGVEIAKTGSNEKRTVNCDTVIFSGNWIPEHEMARLGGLTIDPKTQGPKIDTLMRTSVKGVFAAGNLLRGAEPGDVAAIEGRYSAFSIEKYLSSGTWNNNRLSINVESPLEWITPNAVEPNSNSLSLAYFLFRVKEFCKNPTLVIKQNDNILYEKKYRKIGPNYSFKLDAKWVKKVTGSENVEILLK